MKKKRIITKSTYILVSVSAAAMIIFTSLPYYSLTSIVLPGWNIYWSYEEVQRKMMFLFIGLSFIGALSTIRKKVDMVEDVVLNIGLPFIVLLGLKAMQYQLLITMLVFAIAVVFTSLKVKTFLSDKRYSCGKAKRFRMVYYICRRRMIYSLLFMLVPMAVYVNYQEDTERERIFFQAEAEKTKVSEEDYVLDIVSQEEWDELTVEKKFEELEEFTNFECKRLGIDYVDVYAVKELVDGTLAYYTDEQNAVYYNVIYLNKCTLSEALHVACHETFHKYEQAVIDSLVVLEEAGIGYERLDYYAEALEIKTASVNYGIDSMDYESYTQNLLELKAEEYAEQELKELEEKGYF